MIWLDYEFSYQMAWWTTLVVLTLSMLWALKKRTIRGGFTFPAARLKGLQPSLRTRLAYAPQYIRVFIIAFGLLALARPQLPQEESADVEGIDIIVALDMSGSMIAVDISAQELTELQNQGKEPANRFQIAIKVLKDFIQSRQYDRVSLVIFGKEAFLQFPLTLDYGVMLKILDQMDLGDIDGNATVIGNALAMSLSRLKESDAKSKLVILLTDGEDNGSNISPRELAEEAKRRQVPVFPILVGTHDQSWEPTNLVDTMTGQRRYQRVDNPVNPTLLKEIAQTTSGEFYRATDTESLQKNLHDILDSFEKSRLVDYAVAERTEAAPWLIWMALALLVIELILSQVVVRRFP